MPIVLKSGILKLLEPSGPVQACNGIACFACVYICYTKNWGDERPTYDPSISRDQFLYIGKTGSDSSGVIKGGGN